MTIVTTSINFEDFSTLVPASWLTQMTRQIPKAPNFSDGGEYNPAAPIIIDGAQFQASGTTNIALASRAITRRQSMQGFTNTANWTVRPFGTWRNTVVAGALFLAIDNLPAGGTLDEIVLRWQGAAGHVGLPTLPSFNAYRVGQDGSSTLLGSGSDGSTTEAEYEAAHDIRLAGIAHPIDRSTARYWIDVTGESGGNFVANAEALSLHVVVTTTQYYEW